MNDNTGVARYGKRSTVKETDQTCCLLRPLLGSEGSPLALGHVVVGQLREDGAVNDADNISLLHPAVSGPQKHVGGSPLEGKSDEAEDVEEVAAAFHHGPGVAEGQRVATLVARVVAVQTSEREDRVSRCIFSAS